MSCAESEAARPKRWTASLFKKLAITLTDARPSSPARRRAAFQDKPKNVTPRSKAIAQVTPSPSPPATPPVSPPTLHDARESLAAAVSPNITPRSAPPQRRQSLKRVHIEPVEHVREVGKIAAEAPRRCAAEAPKRCAAEAARRVQASSRGDAEAPGPGWAEAPPRLGDADWEWRDAEAPRRGWTESTWADAPRLATIDAPRRGDAYGETGHSSRRADDIRRRRHSEAALKDCARVAPANACDRRPSPSSQRIGTPSPTQRSISAPQPIPRAMGAVAGLRRKRSDSEAGTAPPVKRSGSGDALQQLLFQQEFLDEHYAEGRASAAEGADDWATAWATEARAPTSTKHESRDQLSALAGCAFAGLGRPLHATPCDARGDDNDEFEDIDGIESIIVF
ncbi:hypothetical protein M885DRAFT_625213 [Pelagophyceae sp. CCMP2097]|nr:hypothetical protein M885DRAFT_625213 [Pelagophyceae sp. CCMP2097]